jgi:hypothetical protein
MGGCDCGAGCCEECGWKARLRGMFHRDSCDAGCDSCGSKHGFRFGWHKQCDDCTWTAPSCNTCDTCHESLLSKLKGRFHRSSCCDTDCCGGGDVMHAAPMGTKTEQLGLPKEGAKPLPNGDKDKDKDKDKGKDKDKTTDKGPSQVQAPVPPAAPTIIEIDPKNPF